MSTQGIDIRQTSNQIIFRSLLQDSNGALVTSGTTTLKLYELQDDGTLYSYDFSDNTFKSTALTTETAAMTHRQGNNLTTNTGLWTYVLSTLTGFTVGNIYFAMVNNTGAFPTDQVREFQFGSFEGDMSVTSGNIHANTQVIAANAVDANALAADAVTEITDDIMSEVVDVLTLKQTLKRILAALSGDYSGASSGTIVFKAQDGVTTEFTATVTGDARTVS